MSNVIWADSFVEVGNILTEIIQTTERKIVYNIWDALVDHTPVCSGKAAASWYVSPQIPVRKDPLPKPDRPAIGEPCERFYDDPRASGMHIGGKRGYFPQYKKNFSKWFINNPIDYIEDLNSGTSKKAPVGFVEMAIDIGLAKSR